MDGGEGERKPKRQKPAAEAGAGARIRWRGLRNPQRPLACAPRRRAPGVVSTGRRANASCAQA